MRAWTHSGVDAEVVVRLLVSGRRVVRLDDLRSRRHLVRLGELGVRVVREIACPHLVPIAGALRMRADLHTLVRRWRKDAKVVAWKRRFVARNGVDAANGIWVVRHRIEWFAGVGEDVPARAVVEAGESESGTALVGEGRNRRLIRVGWIRL